MSALIRAVLSTRSATIRPGERSDLILTVQNFSEIVDRYKIAIEGIDPSWATISREGIALFPKDQDQVRISLHPPIGPEARARTYDLRILVTSEENPTEQTTIGFDLEVTPLPALGLALRPQRQSGMAEGTFTVQVHNQGNTDLSVQLEARDPEDGCQYTFDSSQLFVSAGEERLVQLSVQPTVPLTGIEDKSYPFTVTARTSEAADLVQQTRGEWVHVPPAFELALRPPKQSGTSEGSFTVQVFNQGHTDLTIRLEATDPEEGCWYTFAPAQVVVPAGQERLTKLTVQSKTPPVGMAARSYPFTVTARPAETPRLARQAQGEWEQLPPSFELSLRPQKLSGTTGGTFTVRLRNPGDSSLEVQLEATDPEEGCQYTFEPPRVVLPADQERSAQLTVQPRGPLPGVTAKPYPFTVTARLVETPTLSRQTQGEWVQTPPTFELTLHPQRQSSVSEGVFTVQVHNPGHTDLSVQLEAKDLEGGCICTLASSRLVVPAGQERPVQLQVRPKEALIDVKSRSYPFTVTARPAEAPQLTQRAQGEWVQLPPSFELTLQPERQSSTTEGIFGLRVHNQSNFNLTLQLEATDPAGGCQFSFNTQQVAMSAHEERSVQLRVRAKSALLGVNGRAFPFTITARPAEAPRLIKRLEGEWIQLPAPLKLTLRPQKQSSGSKSAGCAVHILNPSQINLPVQLEATDPQTACRYTFNPPQVDVPAGQERQARLRIRPNTKLRKEARTFAFTVTARPIQAPHLAGQARGGWAQMPWGRRVWRMIWTLLLGLIVTSIAAWVVWGLARLVIEMMTGDWYAAESQSSVFAGIVAFGGLVLTIILARKVWTGYSPSFSAALQQLQLIAPAPAEVPQAAPPLPVEAPRIAAPRPAAPVVQRPQAAPAGVTVKREKEHDTAPQITWRLTTTDGRVFPLGIGTTTIGRKSSSTIYLDDNQASRNHAEIRYVHGRLEIIDLGSTNGTLINGVRLPPNKAHPLNPGDQIEIGQTILTCEK